MTLYHTSPTAITEINSFGRFGEFLFFSDDEYVMTAGDHVVIYSIEMETSEIIEAGQIFCHEDAAKLDGLVEQVMEMVGCDQDTAEDLIAQNEDVHNIDCDVEPEYLADASWDIQRITGEAAVMLGFRGAVMQDEQGAAYLIRMKGHEADLQAAGEQA